MYPLNLLQRAREDIFSYLSYTLPGLQGPFPRYIIRNRTETDCNGGSLSSYSR